MKKLLILIILSFVSLSGVYASSGDLDTEGEVEKISELNTQLYKEAIITRSYIRENFSNGEEILTTLELAFNKIRKNKDIELLKKLQTKTLDLIEIYKAKGDLTRKEKKEYNLILNIFYRAYIELVIFGEIDM